MSNRMRQAGGLVLVVFGVFLYVVLTKSGSNGPAGSPAESVPGANSKTSGSRNEERRQDSEKPVVKPLLDGWQKPAVAFVLTGEMHGYVEPCGCSANQLGGLSRRADLIRQIRERGWPVVALDAGGLVNNPSRRQAKFKFDMALGSLKEMQYAAMGLGVEELLLGIDLVTKHEKDVLPFLAGNLVLFGMTDDSVNLRATVVDSGKLKIGVTSIFGSSLKQEVLPVGAGAEGQGGGGQPAEIQLQDPAEALEEILADLKGTQPDLLVLISHAKLAESKQLAEAFPQFDIILSAGGPEDPNPKPTRIGKTLIVAPGQKGKYVGVVGVYPDDPDEKLRFELVAMDEQRFQETPAIQQDMQAYQDVLREFNLVADELPIENPRNLTVKESNEYVGAKVCGECHKSAYEVWETTRHAEATESLKKGRKDQKGAWINRLYDPECIACHVTGWDPRQFMRYKSGYVNEQTSAHLVGQQCENCHGPGGRHTELERQFKKDNELTAGVTQWRDFLKLVKKKSFEMCARCHDGDNDPHFNSDTFDRYWSEIAHPGKD